MHKNPYLPINTIFGTIQLSKEFHRLSAVLIYPEDRSLQVYACDPNCILCQSRQNVVHRQPAVVAEAMMLLNPRILAHVLNAKNLNNLIISALRVAVNNSF